MFQNMDAVADLFHRAMERDVSERDAFVRRDAATDEIARQVLKLLNKADQADDFLMTSVGSCEFDPKFNLSAPVRFLPSDSQSLARPDTSCNPKKRWREHATPYPDRLWRAERALFQ